MTAQTQHKRSKDKLKNYYSYLTGLTLKKIDELLKHDKTEVSFVVKRSIMYT